MNKYSKYFAIYGTDKLLHGYNKYYDKIIGDQEITSALEIGTREGKGLLSWADIWPGATIEGLDLVEPIQRVSEQFKVHVGTSLDSEFASVAIDRTYDVIIDDGGHHWKDQVATFYNYYEKANKYYVIEDIRGGYCLGRIIRQLPMDVLANISIFHSEFDLGKINFTFSNNIETNTCHFIMFIDKTKV
jgi:hypothetical protein